MIYEYDEQREVFEPRATERLEDDIVQTLVATPVRKGQGATGRLAEVREPIQLADSSRPGANRVRCATALIRAGYRALLAVPLVREDHLIGGLTVFRKTPGAFAADIVELLQDLRHPVRPRHPERAPVPRDRGQEPPARGGQPAQVRVPRQHVPRAAHAAQRRSSGSRRC